MGLLDRVRRRFFWRAEWKRPTVTEGDIEAAYGRRVARSSLTSEIGLTEAKFDLEGSDKAWVEVLTVHHLLFDESIDDPEWWPREEILRPLNGVGDAAFILKHGGIVARLGARWTAAVWAGNPDGDWSPPLEQHVEFLRQLLAGLGPRSDMPVMSANRYGRWYDKYRDARRHDVLAGLPLHEVDAREDARFSRERRRTSLLAGLAVSAFIVFRTGNPLSLEWVAVTLSLTAPIGGALWLGMALQSPARERRKRRAGPVRRR